MLKADNTAQNSSEQITTAEEPTHINTMRKEDILQPTRQWLFTDTTSGTGHFCFKIDEITSTCAEYYKTVYKG